MIVGAIQVGADPEPSDLRTTPPFLTAAAAAGSLATVSNSDPQPHLWAIGSNPYNSGQSWSLEDWYESQLKGAALLRLYVARRHQNGHVPIPCHAYELDCELVDLATYPKPCAGQRPFVGNYSVDGLRIQFCVPGQYDASPWSISRDRQDIEEEAWVQVSVSSDSDMSGVLGGETENVILHCQANSTDLNSRTSTMATPPGRFSRSGLLSLY